MKIIALQAENIKKLVAIDIHPDSNFVEITGKNGQGKTSVLDCIWWGLEGAKHIQKEPIRKGAKSAHIIIDLGELVVTRLFDKRDDGEVTTRLTITNAEGTLLKKPQDVLDSLLGALTFDPLEFTRKTAKEQFNILRQFVPGVDFDAIDTANKIDYDNRTDINKRAKEQRNAAAGIDVTVTDEQQPIDESALVAELAAAGKTNSDIEVRRTNRANVAKEIKSMEVQIEQKRKELEEAVKSLEKIKETYLELKSKLDNAPELPVLIDVSDLQLKISKAKEVNVAITLRTSKKAHIAKADELETEARHLSQDMDKRNAEKLKLIEEAKLPIPGITFGDGVVVLNGVPFEQASYAEQLRASLAIAMALNPKIKIIRCDEGSSLDDDSLKIVMEMAKEKDFQIWLSRTDSSGMVGVVLEEGFIKGQQPQEDF